MKNSYLYKNATGEDAETVKNLINQMYRSEYEVRDNSEIAKAIEIGKEIYVLAFFNNECVGFPGASLDNDYYADIITPDIAVIDYIYTIKEARNVALSFGLISKLLSKLVSMKVKSAIMQVQTFNKQRFFHYGLSDKNIIKSTHREEGGKNYYDQILLISDLEKIAKLTLSELKEKAIKYLREER